jgi:hypothetical protein
MRSFFRAGTFVFAVCTTASCTGADYPGGYAGEDQSSYNQIGADPNLLGAALLLSLLVVAISN